MARKLIAAVFSAILIVGILFSVLPIGPFATEAASTPPAVEWNQTYGSTSTDRAWSVQPTSDGGYIITGDYGGTEGIADAWLIKTNSTGNEEWSHTYDGGSTDFAYSVEQTSNGGYIMAGTSYREGDPLAWLVKTNSAGATEWSKTYGETYLSGGKTGHFGEGYSVQQTRDGGYILAGRTSAASGGSAWLIKTDSAGNAQWNKTYTGGGGDAFAFSVKQTSDGGYVFAGNIYNDAARSTDFWLVKTNSAGATEWSKAYGKGVAKSVQQTPDGGYIVAGYTSPNGFDPFAEDAWVIKTNSTGSLQWSKTMGGTSQDEFWSVGLTSGGGYILGGVNVGIVKMNSTGAVEWNQTYGGTAYSVQQTHDGGYIAAGTAKSPVRQWDADLWLMKLEGSKDTDGDGLLDSWEQNGIDYDGNGIVDLKLNGADWQHKDIFVEVDYMQGHRLSAVARDNVEAAFRDAPVENPDGTLGINIHIEIDDTDNIPHQDSIRTDAYTGNWFDFDDIKKDHFGTASQKGKASVLNAKKMAYHYCLMIQNWAQFNATSMAWEVTGSSGLAEPYGNDFIVSLGWFANGVGSIEEQAATFMHELGHNLGLQHGGNDSIHYKPNYLSIMNYHFQMPNKQFTRPMDYSRGAQPTLNEKDLDEPDGIGAVAYWPATVFSAPVWNATGKYWRFVPLPVSTAGAIDWNNNGDDTETGVWANLNVFPQWGYGYSPNDEILKGYNDWSNLRFRFQDTKDFADNVHSTEFGVDELTWDTVEAMRESLSQLHQVAILNVTSPSTLWQQGTALSLNLLLVNFGGYDENVSITVYANSTIVASASLTVGSGNTTSATLPYNGAVLAPGSYWLKAHIQPVGEEFYTADNTVIGGTITVTEVIPEFPPLAMLAALIVLTLAVSLALKRKANPAAAPKESQSLMNTASSNFLKCSSPVTTLAFAFLAVDRIMESAKPHPFASFLSAMLTMPASTAVSKSKSTIWLVALMNSRRFSRPSEVSFPRSISPCSFRLTSATTIVGVAASLPSMYFLAFSPCLEALKYSIQA